MKGDDFEMLPGLKATQFSKPEDYLADTDAATVGAIIATASDIALIVDPDGTVQDFAIGAEGIDSADFDEWLGHPVEDIVTTESRQKMSDLVAGAKRGEAPRWREVNHRIASEEEDFPVRYCAVRADGGGRIMLLGRDLRPVAALQRRLVSIQQSLERDYGRLLQMETRYRLLFQSASEGFLIVDSGSQRILEANAAAGELLGRPADELARRKFPNGLPEEAARALEAAMTSVRASGRAETISIRLEEDGPPAEALISMFRADTAKHFLIRLSSAATGRASATDGEAQVIELFRRASEGIVLTDGEGRIEWANDSFLDLAQVAVESQVQGESIDRFFTRQGIDLPLILSNTREGGRLRYYSTSLSGIHGLSTDVEVSCVLLSDGARPGYGFVFRNTAFRPSETRLEGAHLPRSAEQLTELIGRVPLKDLVRETVDVIERLCIEAALRMTDDNRASAADLLGLSRQSLYVKLRRYGISDQDTDDES
jgi:transcriptional regulator PpsR